MESALHKTNDHPASLSMRRKPAPTCTYVAQPTGSQPTGYDSTSLTHPQHVSISHSPISSITISNSYDIDAVTMTLQPTITMPASSMPLQSPLSSCVVRTRPSHPDSEFNKSRPGSTLSPVASDGQRLSARPQSLSPQSLYFKTSNRPASMGYVHGRSVSAVDAHGRSVSAVDNLSPATSLPHRGRSASDSKPNPEIETKRQSRRSWLPSRSASPNPGAHTSITCPYSTFLLSPYGNMAYDVTLLQRCEIEHDLWDISADMTVYLHNEQGCRPCFRLPSSCLEESSQLIRLARCDESIKSNHNWSCPESVESSSSHLAPYLQPIALSSELLSPQRYPLVPKKEHLHLYLPQIYSGEAALTPTQLMSSQLSVDEIDALIQVRNMIAFLVGQPLVATTGKSSVFTVLIQLAQVLSRYEFQGPDGIGFGNIVNQRLSTFVDIHGLLDVRASGESAVEALVLGERLKNWALYNEGYVHTVGRYDEISATKDSKLALVSRISLNRLERSDIELSTRLRTVRERLRDFYFPQLFAGSANSTTSNESKVVSYKSWRSAFAATRKFMLAFYKNRYGAWPPNAKSNRNHFEESGLNRLLLKEVYEDICSLYDILVNRTDPTDRETYIPVDAPPAGRSENEAVACAIRRLLQEYDRSTPPVQPPIPYDLPLLPSLHSIRRDVDSLNEKQIRKECLRRLHDSEINTALMQAYNRDMMKSSDFLEAFLAHERNVAKGRSMRELSELRIGQWLFLYALIQTLPPVVTDAPGVQYTLGVETFLCQGPRDPAPWMASGSGTGSRRTSWRMSANTPEAMSYEAIYQRSHAWIMARSWAQDCLHDSAGKRNDTIPRSFSSSPTGNLQGAKDVINQEYRQRSRVVMEQANMSKEGEVTSGAKDNEIGRTHDPSLSFGRILASLE